MALKYKVQERIDKLTNQAEALVAADMFAEFNRAVLRKFKVNKNKIENWQDLDSNPGLYNQLTNRLQALALQGPDWNDNQLELMGALCALIWNVNGDK